MNDTSLVKSDPPPPSRNTSPGFRATVVEKLKADPGNWYELKRPNHWGSNSASDWRKQFRGLDAIIRRATDVHSNPGNPRYRLWLRWPES